MRLGVFLPNWVGDVVMATPALRTMRKFVGDDGQLVGIMRPYVAEVLAGTSTSRWNLSPFSSQELRIIPWIDR